MASRPKAEPPDKTSASTRSTVIAGSSSAPSRTPGAPPSIAIEATAGSTKIRAVTPEARRASAALPTLRPGTSVIRFFKSGIIFRGDQASLFGDVPQHGNLAARRDLCAVLLHAGDYPPAAGRDRPAE